MAELITGHKTSEQIDAMRQGGKILAQIFNDLRGFVHAGQTKREVDNFAAQKIIEYGADITYKTPEVNFPGAVCISVNEEVVHGVPNDQVLEVGDVVSFDLVITYKNMKVDSVKHLLTATERSLYAGIDAIKGPVYTGDIGAAIEKVLRDAKLGIVRELVGHGVGLRMHMPPDIPNYGRRGSGVLLRPGDTVAIEPMATLGGEKVIELDDDWTYATRDGSLAAHFEHTVLITETGAEIITQA